MVNLLNINARVEVNLKSDRSDPKTIFVLRPLTGPERLDLTRFFKVEIGTDKKPKASLLITGEYSRAMLSRTIIEIKNRDEKMSIVEIIDRLNPHDLIELVSKVSEMSTLTETERKNS